MTTHTRRSFLAFSGAAAFAAHTTSARIRAGGRIVASCGANMATPVASPIASDIPFEQAYIDTTIPYHTSAIALVSIAWDDLEDERLIEISQSIRNDFPGELDELHALREAILGDAEPEEATKEMMMLSMGGVESCSDQSHMDFMKPEWVTETYSDRDDKELTYASMMVLLLEMEMHQHMVAEQWSSDEALLEFCQRMHELRDPQIQTLKTVRGELLNAY